MCRKVQGMVSEVLSIYCGSEEGRILWLDCLYLVGLKRIASPEFQAFLKEAALGGSTSSGPCTGADCKY